MKEITEYLRIRLGKLITRRGDIETMEEELAAEKVQLRAAIVAVRQQLTELESAPPSTPPPPPSESAKPAGD